MESAQMSTAKDSTAEDTHAENSSGVAGDNYSDAHPIDEEVPASESGRNLLAEVSSHMQIYGDLPTLDFVSSSIDSNDKPLLPSSTVKAFSKKESHGFTDEQVIPNTPDDDEFEFDHRPLLDKRLQSAAERAETIDVSATKNMKDESIAYTLTACCRCRTVRRLVKR